ncbi:hypothetical protein LOK49_LG01G00135 [Camellia lanceoleosa]|uniref:Uncharacterized protein n=1 Tax=Camellia lanceoleosa TaxID=1840588 RepID=A0ACC0J688_9ERIC|nr:hypothetical protein LOK49_LG01G00135 [Camellia lanceoleosa]
MPRSFGGGGASSSASSGSNNIKNAATLRGLSSLNKNLERILATNSNSCPILLDLYEECISRTPTDYGAEWCDPYRKMMASCGEIKRDPSLRRMAERRKRLSSKPTNPLVTLDGALYSDLTFHGKDMQPKKHIAIVPTSSHKKRACIKPIVDWEESQLREAIAKGFSNREEYWRHQSETDPKTCRITYELYEECRQNKSEESCKYFRNKCPQFKQAPN